MRHFGIRTRRYKSCRFYGKQDYWDICGLQEELHELPNIDETQSYVDVVKELKERLVVTVGRYKD